MTKFIKLFLALFLSISLLFASADQSLARGSRGGYGGYSSSGYRSSGRSSYKSSSASKSISVKGYTRKNGTYVAPHTRSVPHSKSSNYAPSKLIKSSTSSSKVSNYISSKSPKSSSTTSVGVPRDSKGHIKRSAAAKKQFMKQTGFPHGRPGYVIDHIVPLKRGGADDPSNMQWQTKEEAKAKDKTE